MSPRSRVCSGDTEGQAGPPSVNTPSAHTRGQVPAPPNPGRCYFWDQISGVSFIRRRGRFPFSWLFRRTQDTGHPPGADLRRPVGRGLAAFCYLTTAQIGALVRDPRADAQSRGRSVSGRVKGHPRLYFSLEWGLVCLRGGCYRCVFPTRAAEVRPPIGYYRML